MTLKHFLNGPNRTNFEKRKNAEIAKNSMKNGSFNLQNAKTRAVFKPVSTWNFVHVYIWEGFFTYILLFWKLENFLHIFFKIDIICWLSFTTFKIFKFLEIRDSSLLATGIPNITLKANCFYHLKRLRDSVSRKPLLLPKSGKPWRHLWPTYHS